VYRLTEFRIALSREPSNNASNQAKMRCKLRPSDNASNHAKFIHAITRREILWLGLKNFYRSFGMELA
jgi:hypothetical protein